MIASILATKLYIPPQRPGVITRSNLNRRLNEGLNRKLILISAPAGFGKTTLAAEWIAGCHQPAAWLSLDERDNDPAVFLTYLVSALQTVAPKIGEGILGIIQAAQSPPPPTESLLTTLLNELANISDNFILVLDDYHLIENPSLNQALIFLIEHMPPRMRLVIATREDPPFPLSRWRARCQLIELRAADLRFTPAEATEFLNKAMDLNLSPEDIAALEARTEGWIAGLQLAALSMRGREDIAGFIQAFTGSHRFVLDYLIEEVLRRQSENIRSFLLQTAILDRFCASLCNAVADRQDSKEILDTLERSNLFLIPLDDKRQWYRYHHLFADVLQTHLMETLTEKVSSLHQKASIWYELNGLTPDAIRHGLAAKDFERAAGLIELAWSAMDISYQSSTWLGWAKALPDELIRARPVLSVGYAWALLDVGELEPSEARLHDAERWLNTPIDKITVADIGQFRSLPTSIATARAYRSLALGDVTDAVRYAQKALNLASEDDQTRQIQALSLLWLAQYSSGDLEAAERSLTDFHTKLRKTGEITTLIVTSFLLADIRVAMGRLRDAESTYRQALQLATDQGEPMPLGTADLYRGLSELSIELGNQRDATQHLLTSQKSGEQTATTDWPHRLCVSKARLKEAQGDLDGALALLDEAEHVYVRNPLPDVHPVKALKAGVWLKQSRLDEALEWVRERGLSVNDDILFTREFEYITLARVLIAAGKNDRKSGFIGETFQLLGRLLQAAENGRRLDSVIRILLLQTLAFHAQGDLPHALSALDRSLALAEPEGYVRIFIDEDETMRILLEKLSRNRDHPQIGYVDKLLSAFPKAKAVPESDLIEPLSERELEVLRLLRSELNGPEIAEQLIISLNTFRTHTKSIFTKLGVNNRHAAVHHATELGLI
jgi:LuxR family maltose regulon positive regulatory protein